LKGSGLKYKNPKRRSEETHPERNLRGFWGNLGKLGIISEDLKLGKNKALNCYLKKEMN